MFEHTIKKQSRLHSAQIARFIAENWETPDSVCYSLEAPCAPMPSAPMPVASMQMKATAEKAATGARKESTQELAFGVPDACVCESDDLQTYLEGVKDESFTQMLLRKIDEKGIKDAQCYKKANIDKRLFSKIRSNVLYKPSKSTALALIVALEMPFDESAEMLKKAGYAFSHASKADLIVEYYLRHGIYSLPVINQSLLEFDQPLIGNFS